MEISTDAYLLSNIHQLLSLANSSSQYLSRQYNPRFDKILHTGGSQKAAFDFFEKTWSVEEAVTILKEATSIGLNKGSERLDEWVSRCLISSSDEFRQKPYILEGYLKQIMQRKKFKKPNLSLYLDVIDLYYKEMQENKKTQEGVKRALYTIEDNLKAGVADYDVDRKKIAEIVARDTWFIQANKEEELVAMAERERVVSEIKKAINERT